LFLPLDERTTRVFFLFYFDALRIPGTSIPIPRWLMKPVLAVANKVMIRPLLQQDGTMVEAEQLAYEANAGGSAIELNPAVIEFQKMMISAWERYLDGHRAHPLAREARLA
jgi:hypothetical protein